MGGLSISPSGAAAQPPTSSSDAVDAVTMPRVEHRFTGPSYTIGIEEELMIVDAETLELVNSIRAEYSSKSR